MIWVLAYIEAAGRRTGTVAVRFRAGLLNEPEDTTMNRSRCVALALLSILVLAGCDYLPNGVPPHEAQSSANIDLSVPDDTPRS